MAGRQKNWPRHILSTSIRMKSLNSSKQERKRSIKKSKHVETIRSRKLLQSLISKLHLHLQVKGGGQKKNTTPKKKLQQTLTFPRTVSAAASWLKPPSPALACSKAVEAALREKKRHITESSKPSEAFQTQLLVTSGQEVHWYNRWWKFYNLMYNCIIKKTWRRDGVAVRQNVMVQSASKDNFLMMSSRCLAALAMRFNNGQDPP